MNGQYFGEQINTSDGNEKTEWDTNSPGLNSEDFSAKVPLDAEPIQETPMDVTNAAVDPLDKPIVQDAPMAEPVHYDAPPQDEVMTHPTPTSTNAGSQVALLDQEVSDQLRTRWNEIQGTFVDEPRSAVQQADALVSEVIEKINQMFSNEHSTLEGQWKQGKDVSTEDLRKALQHYRAFFNRLVT